MINIYKERNNEFSIKFYSTDNFNELLEICRNNNLKYNKYKLEDKKWYGGNVLLENVLNDIKGTSEDIKYYPDKEEIERLSKNNLDYKKLRIRYLPRLFKGDYYGDFQEEGIRKLISYNSFLLTDSCGIGKSIQSITAVNHLWEYNLIDRLFIISINQSTLYNWKKELLRFSTFIENDDEIAIVDKDNRNIFENSDQYKVIITDYNTYKLISDYHYYKIKKKKVKNYQKTYIPFDKNWRTKSNRCIILDESHGIKNNKSQVHKKIKLIRDYFHFRYGLSATPAPNLVSRDNNDEDKVTDIEELFNIFSFLDSNIIGLDNQTFKKTYFNLGDRFSDYSINYVYGDKYDLFMQKIAPYTIGRRKEDVLPDMVNKNIKKIFVPLSDKHKEIYLDFCENQIGKYVEKQGKLEYRVLKSKFMLINLLCSEPSLVKITDDIVFDKELLNQFKDWKFKYNNKIKYCDEIIKEHSPEKTIIWSFHPKTINQLAEHYKKYNPIIYHGETKVIGKKSDFINNLLLELKNNKEVKLGIFNPLVLGTGVNIEFITQAIFFDRTFDVKAYIQALDRIHRITSVNDVYVYNLIFDKTIEVYQDKILESKESLNDKLKDLTIDKILDKIVNIGR